MNVSVTILLGDDDTFTKDPNEAITDVLTALGGDPSKDTGMITISQAPVAGGVGPPNA